MTERFADHPVFGDVALALAPRSLEPQASPEPQASIGQRRPVVFHARSHTFDEAVRELAFAASRSAGDHDAQRIYLRADELKRAAAASPVALALLRAHENAECALAPPRILGVVNATPDSFSDGGRFFDPDRAVEHGLALAAEGADVIDVGGESTRPGAQPVTADEELRRVIPVLRGLARSTRTPLSIDTTKAEVAEAALETGASIVNDISAGRVDPRMLALVARRGAGFIAMHSRGSPRHMQENPAYDDVVSEVVEHLRERVRAALEAGVDLAKIWIDPGIGFGTALEHNLELLARLAEMRSLGLPVCVGVSRKSFISAVEGRTGAQLASADTEQRVGGTAAAIAVAVWNGAEILRVHDVRTMAQAARVAWACRTSLAPSEMNRTTPRSCPSRDEAHNQD